MSDDASRLTAGNTDLTVLPDGFRNRSERVGPYRLIQVLGEGGMGVVFEAEQKEPIRRRVALKLIKLGMDSREVVARFESERQALALMDHPSIAKVYDAGSTPEGRPYFAMELVHGEQITRFCDANRLSNSDRVELFTKVCDGIQHAHQKGVIHRDLEPSNILVTHRDGTPVPKIIDFGVAKATAQPLTEQSMYTEVGQLIGTPEYMSPEQADLRGLDIDTRSDVYSLGVLLYELLAGRLPFNDLRQNTYDEVLRRIREEDPPRPSTIVTGFGEEIDSTARNRRTDPPALVRQLRGDLDWITMKALEKDRNRRYASASELRADLERHQRHEPVLASPPSRGYLVRKFVRRHTAGVAFASALLVLLAVFGATMAFQRARISREVRTAEHVLTYLANLLEHSSPLSASGDPVSIDDVLDDEVLRGRPDAQARLLATLAASYENFDLYHDAIRAREFELELRRRISGEGSLEVTDAKHRLAAILQRAGRNRRAGELAGEVLAERSRVLPPGDPAVLDTRFLLALTRSGTGDLDGAQRDLEAVLDARRGSSADLQPAVVETLAALGRVQRTRLDYGAADASLSEARRLAAGLSPPDDRLLTCTLEELAQLKAETGQLREAEALLGQSQSILRRKPGERNPRLGATLRKWSGVMLDRSRFLNNYESSIGLARQALALQVSYLGEDHIETARSQLALTEAWSAAGAAFEISKFSRRALELYQAAIPSDNAEMADVLTLRGHVLLGEGDAAAAERLLSRAFEIRREHLPAAHWKRIEVAVELSLAQAALGRFEEATQLSEASFAAGDLEARHLRHKKARLLERMILLQLVTGNLERAAHYRDRRLELGSLLPVVYRGTTAYLQDAAVDINYTDDFIERTIAIDAGDLARTRAATLWVFGRPYNWIGHPFVDREDHLVRVNGDSEREITFDVGLAFHYMTEDFHWAPFAIPVEWLEAGPNTFLMTERSLEGSWDHNNLLIGIDLDQDQDTSWWRADGLKDCYDFKAEQSRPEKCAGELMIWLELDAPRDETRPNELARALDFRAVYSVFRFGAVLLSTRQFDAADSVFEYAQRGFSEAGRPVELALAEGGRGAALVGRGETTLGLAMLEASAEALRPVAPVKRPHKFHFDAVRRVHEQVDPERAAAYHRLLALF